MSAAPTELQQPDLRAAGLSAFQQTILTVLADSGEQYGLGVRQDLECVFGEEVHHSRLYQNLDDLADAGLVEKRAIDRRTNGYQLTDDGRDVLHELVAWRADHLGLDVDGTGGDSA